MIKKFEQYREELYKEIKSREYYNLYYPRKGEKFTDNEISKLKEIVFEMNIDQIAYRSSGSVELFNWNKEKRGAGWRPIIAKYFDDWFVLEDRRGIPNRFYLCDQFDGLIKCLKDLYDQKI